MHMYRQYNMHDKYWLVLMLTLFYMSGLKMVSVKKLILFDQT